MIELDNAAIIDVPVGDMAVLPKVAKPFDGVRLDLIVVREAQCSRSLRHPSDSTRSLSEGAIRIPECVLLKRRCLRS